MKPTAVLIVTDSHDPPAKCISGEAVYLERGRRSRSPGNPVRRNQNRSRVAPRNKARPAERDRIERDQGPRILRGPVRAIRRSDDRTDFSDSNEFIADVNYRLKLIRSGHASGT